MTILRTVSLVLASSVVFASAASADYGQRENRGNRGDRPQTLPGRPAVLPTLPVIRPQPPAPPLVINKPLRPGDLGLWWKRDRHDRDDRDFRGRHHDRRWYGWW